MDFEKKLKDLNQYGISFEIKQGYYHVALTFNDAWNVLVPENENIYLEERNGVHHYIAPIEDIKIDDIFDSINETIEYNNDLEKKLQLFREKTAELQELFSTETYDKLETIKFVFENKETEKKTTKRTKKTKEMEKNPKKDKKNKQKITKKTTKTSKKSQNQEILEKETVVEDNNYVQPIYEEETVVPADSYIEELER